jgi:hypothetical protein
VQYPSSQFNVSVSLSKDVTVDGETGHCSLDVTGVIGTIDSNNEDQALGFLGEFVDALREAGFEVAVARTGGVASAVLEEK